MEAPHARDGCSRAVCCAGNLPTRRVTAIVPFSGGGSSRTRLKVQVSRQRVRCHLVCGIQQGVDNESQGLMNASLYVGDTRERVQASDLFRLSVSSSASAVSLLPCARVSPALSPRGAPAVCPRAVPWGGAGSSVGCVLSVSSCPLPLGTSLWFSTSCPLGWAHVLWVGFVWVAPPPISPRGVPVVSHELSPGPGVASVGLGCASVVPGLSGSSCPCPPWGMPVGFHGLPLGAAAVPPGLGGASFPALGCVQNIVLPAHCFSVEEVQVAVGLHDPRYYREYLTLRG